MLLTVAEAAGDLRVSTRTVRRLVADGSLPSIRLGRSVRVAESDLADYVSRKRSAGEK